MLNPTTDARALVAIDLGAESCRVSLLRWTMEGPRIELLHRFANAPEERAGHLYWPIEKILGGLFEGLRRAGERATEGIRAIGVDGWAVDYVRLDEKGQAVGNP